MNRGQQASETPSLFPLQSCVKLSLDSDYPAELKFMRCVSVSDFGTVLPVII